MYLIQTSSFLVKKNLSFFRYQALREQKEKSHNKIKVKTISRQILSSQRTKLNKDLSKTVWKI